MRALAMVLLLLGSLAVSGSPADPVQVRVRIEGAWAHLWSGTVALEGTYVLIASNSGRTHVLEARTPLGALAAAAQQADIDVQVTDEYADFVVLALDGDHWFGTRWWDYRVDWVEPNYGPQQQWQAWRPLLEDGQEVLWYLDALGTTPLHLTPLAAPPGPPCAHAARVETLAVDVVHQPGQPWPPVLWRPVPLARLTGAFEAPVVAGAGAGVGGSGPYWAEEQALPLTPLVHYIRSESASASC